ncbi:MAG: hypothetical protein H0U74_15630 [Bradymonadaceae bacterium]|nr:hypothetical protein [Lujinxingiaceae bacterium]
MTTPSRENELLAELARQAGMPVIAIAANWQGEYAVDLDAHAARIFYDVLAATIAAEDVRPRELALVVAGQGGYPAFADAIRRAFSGLGICYRVYLPCTVDASLTLICLGATQIVLHPFGGLGPLDAGPLIERSSPDVELCGHGALQLVQRLLPSSGHSFDTTKISRLQSVQIGPGTALGEVDLKRLGIKAHTAEAEEQDALWRLYEHVEHVLGLTRRPQERFTPSEQWPDEVEFEPATEMIAALICSTARRAVLELDTGRPDPDMPRLHGAWHITPE